MPKNVPEVVVNSLILNKENKILLLRSHKWYNRYIFPSGHVKYKESLKKAVKREVKEETNLNIKKINFLMVNELIKTKEFYKRDKHFIIMTFISFTNNNKVKLNNEAESYAWIKPKKAFALNLDSLTKSIIKYYLDENAR